ncbi:2-C-methyl-D-erythritol 2,4-cyclodiphosphate synthase [Oceanisphaera marina]|uniref:2-C-methyl-D-erythritol 2,4-cyclodiphosphate synthase n=1 Tax=Oceanisphaera marina TaxID=2017550 RepID=A0ABQ1IWQ7_9GAMM|nr:2-C-methyl-D-erythritol 2,4-cyclodiphosphate synthase [Oceanisphaera marina]GGB52952.1 2-C-methyl-D-erythritol 2,4-cyclodiphosphate synthase [Oceanisphaera marina]
MMRIGHGYDVHKFGGQGPCILAGVAVPYEQGLLAHSDGDVVLHALTDALLGAIGAGDIGRHFPDTDAAYAGIDSRVLLREVVALVKQAGFTLGNADVTVLAQAPRLSPFIDDMVANIAADLGVATSLINVKATTTEQLGFVGRKEGIAAEAVVLLVTA